MSISSFIVVDIETTGLNCETDEIIRIVAKKFLQNKHIDSLDLHVNPQKKLTKKVAQILDLPDDFFANATDLKTAICRFDAFIEQLPIVDYNAKFDLGFLNKAFAKHMSKALNNKIFCILEMAKMIARSNPSYKLSSYKFSNIVAKYLPSDKLPKNDNIIIERALITALLFEQMQNEQ